MASRLWTLTQTEVIADVWAFGIALLLPLLTSSKCKLGS